MSINFAPDQKYNKLLNEYKKFGYATKTALLNDALRLLLQQNNRNLRAQWRKDAAAKYAKENHENVWKDIDGEDFE